VAVFKKRWSHCKVGETLPFNVKKQGQLGTRTFLRIFIGVLLISLTAGSCKTTKRKGDLSPLGKFYHNTTAEYNGYFNAGVLLEESMVELDSQYRDNYNKILPLYKYREAGNPKAVAEKLDRAIEKSSVVVALHRYSNWTDDCYLLIGQAQYLKQDFEAAEETLEYLTGNYKPSLLKSAPKKEEVKKKSGPSKKNKKKSSSKKRKKSSSSRKPRTGTSTPKEKIEPGVTVITLGDNKVEVETGKPESYFLRHRPCYQDGLLWLARTYIERENYFEADRIIYQLTKNAGTFPSVRRDLAVVEAYYYLKQKKTTEAIAPLERAISLTKDRLLKARYTFILGQIYLRMGKNDLALQAFEKVVKYKPSYEMDFSARLNMTRIAWASGGGSFEPARKDLERMLKDIKNADYKDQIYFALAELDLKEGNKDQAIQDLRQCLASSSSAGSAQKAEAYLMLANLYFESEKFVETKKYLDSTLTLLPRTDERYLEVSTLASNLTEIADNLEIIQLQDSLLNLASLSDAERTAIAAGIKKSQDEARRKALLEASQKGSQAPGVTGGGGSGPRAGGVKSDFFAYDDRSVKRGQKEFERIWGNRPLEDNWRRSSGSGGAGLTEETPTGDDAPASTALTEEDVKAIFRDVPKTEEEITAANEKIMTALFSLGRLYREKLENEERAIASLEELLDRYPQTKYRPEAFYLLYLAYLDSGKNAEAKKYYDLLVSEFPDSPYALMLTDPDYLQKTKDREERINQYYDQVFAAFQRGQYRDAYEQINKVPALFGAAGNSHQPRFELLKAMCLGNLEGKAAYVSALKEMMERYPTAPEQKHAVELLRLLGEYTASGPGGTTLRPEEETYVFEPDDRHYIIVVFSGNVALENAKIQLSDYHLKFHKLEKLRISNIVLGDLDIRTQILVVRSFDNMKGSLDYLQGVEANRQEFLSPEFKYEVFPISQNNYRQMLKNKVVSGYPEFYQKNYK